MGEAKKLLSLLQFSAALPKSVQQLQTLVEGAEDRVDQCEQEVLDIQL